MSTEQNTMLARRLFEETWNSKNLAVMDELLAPNFVFHNSVQTLYGPEGFKQFATIYHRAFPQAHFTIEDTIAQGDMVALRWTARGKQDGELLGIPPTGKEVTVTGISLTLISNGKTVESWGEFDALGMLHQIGVIPKTGPARCARPGRSCRPAAARAGPRPTRPR
jgi:predicted ester cyclase